MDTQVLHSFANIPNDYFLKALATILYFIFHFFLHLLIFLQFRDPSYVLSAREPNICSLN